MGDYQITCTRKDGADADRRIDALGGTFGKASIDKVIHWIKGGHTFWVEVYRRRVGVEIGTHYLSGRDYLTMQGDSFPPNNLLELPDCL